MRENAMADQRSGEGGRLGAGKVDVESIRQLLALMNEHGLVELEIEQDDLVVRLRKAGAAAPTVQAVPVPVPVAAPVASPGLASPPAAGRQADEPLPAIRSPMVGTFYEAPSPDADPYVEVGDHVREDTVVCIIEAMKVFNEIKAEMSGTIEKILVKNAQPVEFGLPLFIVRPD
jgi:acetyl-CoA carboxylase biotin carboxyl carrier protein